MLSSFTLFYWPQHKQNSKRHAHIFEVKHISGDNYRQRPTLTHTESRYGGHQTGGKRLSISLVAYRNGFHISEKRLVQSPMSPNDVKFCCLWCLLLRSTNTATAKPEVVVSHVAAQIEEKFQQLFRWSVRWRQNLSSAAYLRALYRK